MSIPDHPYRPAIEDVCRKVGTVPPDVLEAMMIVESNGNPKARSVSDARGLLQIIYRWHASAVDQAASELGKTGGADALYDPDVNLLAGTRILRWFYVSDDTPSWERAVRKYHSGSWEPPADFRDGGGVSSDFHIEKFRKALADVQASRSTQEDAPVALHMMTWPGLPGGPIGFTFPVSTRWLVPASRTLQRPGIKARHPRHAVSHSNGNPAVFAVSDSIYLHNGAGGRQASWHGTVDHREGYANLPADEVGWHAGDGAGPGNYNGFAVELSERMHYHMSAADARQGRKNAAEMMGRVMARLDSVSPQFSGNPRRHNQYMVKGCPRVILASPAFLAEYEKDFWFFYNDEKARMKGATPPKPVSGGVKVGAHVEVAVAVLNLRHGPGTTYPITRELREEAKAVVIDGPRTGNGYTWWDLKLDGGGTGWVADGIAGEPWLKVIAAPAPPPPPKVYAPKAPVHALLETNLKIEDMYNTAVAVKTVSEIDFIFVADVIEFKRESKAQQYAGDGAAEVQEPYQEGDRAIAAWITKIADGTYWYLLTGGDDEWVRVRVSDTVRVADAPLLPIPAEEAV